MEQPPKPPTGSKDKTTPCLRRNMKAKFRQLHTLKWYSKMVDSYVHVMWLSCFFHDPADVGNLISGSSALHHEKRWAEWSTGWNQDCWEKSKCLHPLDHQKSKRVPEKHLLLLYWLHQSLWLCRSQQTVENSERDGNTRPPDLPPEKSVCRPRSNR